MSPPHMSGREQELVADAFASNWVAPVGPYVDMFEQRLAELTGVPHVAALSSGTAALHVALRLSGVTSGDQVWSPSLTFIGGVAPILYQGAEPVFLDSEATTLLIDLDLLEESLSAALRNGNVPKAIITTDLYGMIPDIDRLAALRRQYGFVWISDAAESLGSYRNGRHAGVEADFSILSFNGNKIITTSGGGALMGPDKEAIDRARYLSTQARELAPHYEHVTIGYNYRLSNISAAIGVGQLEVLADRVRARRRIHAYYRELLDGLDGLSFTDEPDGLVANRWLTTIRIDSAVARFTSETARLALEAAGIESRPIWKPMHMQPVFQGASFIGGTVAERAFADGLCLPSGSAMTDADVGRVAAVLRGLA